jgi:hypothetical protein
MPPSFRSSVFWGWEEASPHSIAEKRRAVAPPANGMIIPQSRPVCKPRQKEKRGDLPEGRSPLLEICRRGSLWGLSLLIAKRKRGDIFADIQGRIVEKSVVFIRQSVKSIFVREGYANISLHFRKFFLFLFHRG